MLPNTYKTAYFDYFYKCKSLKKKETRILTCSLKLNPISLDSTSL